MNSCTSLTHLTAFLSSSRFNPRLLLALALSALSALSAPGVRGAEPLPAVAPASKPALPGAINKEGAAAVAPAKAVPSRKGIIFRNVRSWKRAADFEEALGNLGFKFDVKTSAQMATTDLTPYGFVIVPGGQWEGDFYQDYADQAAKFDQYATNGGILLLELNGAENGDLVLPRGVTMSKHGARENVLALPSHPILQPLEGKAIHANFASHGFLENVPKDALVLVTEVPGGQQAASRPTFIEYSCGSGRVIAACQCFHDQDGSGRGVLMDSALTYASEREWYAPKK